MPDDFDAAALLAALDQTEAAGVPPHLVEQLRALVREEERRRGRAGFITIGGRSIGVESWNIDVPGWSGPAVLRLPPEPPPRPPETPPVGSPLRPGLADHLRPKLASGHLAPGRSRRRRGMPP